jgi:hypothetical protein
MLESLSACFTGPAHVEESVATPRNRRDWPTSAQLTELSRLKRENSELRRTNEILRLAGSFRPGGRPDQAAAVAFVQAHRGQFGVAPLCRVLGMPR